VRSAKSPYSFRVAITGFNHLYTDLGPYLRIVREVKNALYIRFLEDARIAQTIPLGQGKYLDVTETGDIVGLEIILASSSPQEALASNY
jgi:uncharacterized protein YuzE